MAATTKLVENGNIELGSDAAAGEDSYSCIDA